MDSWKYHLFLNYLFLGKVTTDKAVIYKYSKTCQVEALRELETTNTNHSPWSKINTHLPERNVWAQMHSVLTHICHRETGRVCLANSSSPPALYNPARAHQYLQALASEENKSPVYSFQHDVLSSSQQNQKLWAVRKLILAFLLLNPLVFCGRPWHGFRQRSTQLSELRTGLTFCTQQTVPLLKTENTEGLHSTFQVMRCHCCLFKGRHASSHAPAGHPALYKHAPLANTGLPLAVLVGRTWNDCQIQWPANPELSKNNMQRLQSRQTRWKRHIKKGGILCKHRCLKVITKRRGGRALWWFSKNKQTPLLKDMAMPCPSLKAIKTWMSF